METYPPDKDFDETEKLLNQSFYEDDTCVGLRKYETFLDIKECLFACVESALDGTKESLDLKLGVIGLALIESAEHYEALLAHTEAAERVELGMDIFMTIIAELEAIGHKRGLILSVRNEEAVIRTELEERYAGLSVEGGDLSVAKMTFGCMLQDIIGVYLDYVIQKED